MKKVCEDCHKTFECPNNRCTRCPECQEAYRKEFQKEYQKDYQKEWKEDNPDYHKEYWNDKPNTHQRDYYRFWRFCTTLTDDERRALVTKRINDLRHDTTDDEWRKLRTEIKILCHTYEGHKEDIYELRNTEREKLEELKKGVYDE